MVSANPNFGLFRFNESEEAQMIQLRSSDGLDGDFRRYIRNFQTPALLPLLLLILYPPLSD